MHCFNSAREWLRSIGNSMVEHHYGMMIYPLGFIAVLLLAKSLEKKSQNESCKEIDCV